MSPTAPKFFAAGEIPRRTRIWWFQTLLGVFGHYLLPFNHQQWSQDSLEIWVGIVWIKTRALKAPFDAELLAISHAFATVDVFKNNFSKPSSFSDLAAAQRGRWNLGNL